MTVELTDEQCRLLYLETVKERDVYKPCSERYTFWDDIASALLRAMTA